MNFNRGRYRTFDWSVGVLDCIGRYLAREPFWIRTLNFNLVRYRAFDWSVGVLACIGRHFAREPLFEREWS